MYRLLETPNSLWKKLWMMYYQVEVSEEFLNCADLQLTSSFEKITGINAQLPIRFSWEIDQPFIYEKGILSRIKADLWLKYGKCCVQIMWKSKSGRIYEMTDKDIDCNDLEFWIEGIDVKLANHYWRPKWSLITFKELFIAQFINKHDLNISKSFVACMDEQLSATFTKLTDIKINKEVGLICEEINFYYNKAAISSFSSKLYVNHNWERVIITWQSESGRVYEFSDEDIDCNDIKFGFDGLNIPLIHSYAYAKGTLPFKLKDLSYELKVGNFSINCQFDLVLKKDHIGLAESYLKNIDDFIDSYNDKSEKQDRKNGVVHNWSHDIVNDVLIYEVDLGSTGADFMKKLLKHLSGMNCFEQVSIT